MIINNFIHFCFKWILGIDADMEIKVKDNMKGGNN